MGVGESIAPDGTRDYPREFAVIVDGDDQLLPVYQDGDWIVLLVPGPLGRTIPVHLTTDEWAILALSFPLDED